MKLQEVFVSHYLIADSASKKNLSNKALSGFVEAILYRMPELTYEGYDKGFILKILTSPYDERSDDLLEFVYKKAKLDLEGTISEYAIGVLGIDNSQAFIKLMSAFLNEEDIDVLITRGVSCRITRLKYKVDIYTYGAQISGSFIADIIACIYADEIEAIDAHKRLADLVYKNFSNYDPFLKSSFFSDIRKRIVGQDASVFLTKPVLSKIVPSALAKYLNDAGTSYNLKNWKETDLLVRDFGGKLSNTNGIGNQYDFDYFERLVTTTNDVGLVMKMAKYARREPNGFKTARLINQALLRNIDSVDVNELTKEHALAITNKSLLERLIPSCSGKVKIILAWNYGHEEDRSRDENGDRCIDEPNFNWSFIESNIDEFIRCWFEDYDPLDISLENLERMWCKATKVKSKQYLLSEIGRRISEFPDNQDELVERYSNWASQDPKSFNENGVINFHWGQSKKLVHAATLLWPYLGDKPRTMIVKELNESTGMYGDYDFDTSGQLLTYSAVHDLDGLIFGEKKQLLLLMFISNDSLMHIGGILEKLEKSAAAVPYLAKGLSNIDCSKLDDLGVYTHKSVNIRNAAQWSLSLKSDFDAANIVARLMGDKSAKLDDIKRSIYIDVLEKNGMPYEGYEPVDVLDSTALSTYCAKKTTATLAKKVKRVLTPKVVSLWGKDPKIIEYALAQVASSPWGGVPRVARQCFNLVPENKMHQVTGAVLQEWHRTKLDKAYDWLLRLAEIYQGDDIVIELKNIVVSLSKKSPQRALNALDTLANISSKLALYECNQFYKEKKHPDKLRERAKGILGDSARERGITLNELLDELIPTLGLNQNGIDIETGARRFRITLGNQLVPELLDLDKNKSYKSFPKKIDGEDNDQMLKAELSFSTLKKNIKPLVKSLTLKLIEEYECQYSWSYDRWRKLFLENPIRKTLAKQVVWVSEASGTRQVFSVSDSGPFNAAGDDLLFEKGEISLLHPTASSDKERRDWHAKFKKFAIKNPLPQFGENMLTGANIDMDADSLIIFNKRTATFGKLKRVMKKYNFESLSEDGSRIYAFYKEYQNAEYNILVQMIECKTYLQFDVEVVIGEIEFRKGRNWLKMRDVPKSLICSTISVLSQVVS